MELSHLRYFFHVATAQSFRSRRVCRRSHAAGNQQSDSFARGRARRPAARTHDTPGETDPRGRGRPRALSSHSRGGRVAAPRCSDRIGRDRRRASDRRDGGVFDRGSAGRCRAARRRAPTRGPDDPRARAGRDDRSTRPWLARRRIQHRRRVWRRGGSRRPGPQSGARRVRAGSPAVRGGLAAHRRPGGVAMGPAAVPWSSTVPGTRSVPQAIVGPRVLGATIELLQAGIALACSGRYLACFPGRSRSRRELSERRLRVLRGCPKIAPFELGVFTRRRTAPSPAVEALIATMREVLHERPPRRGARRSAVV